MPKYFSFFVDYIISNQSQPFCFLYNGNFKAGGMFHDATGHRCHEKLFSFPVNNDDWTSL